MSTPPASASPIRRLARRLRLGLARRLDPAGALPRPDPAALVREREDALAGDLLARAGEAAGERRWRDAALLYAEALRLRPEHFGAQVQAGHMFKEAGDLARAEGHYRAAAALEPGDADLALQLGHFYKVAGQLNRSEGEYRRALALQPGWEEPARELAALGEGSRAPEPLLADAAADFDRLVPELYPRPESARLRTTVDAVRMHRLGARRERTRWGVLPTLRGVEAIHGYCISSLPITEFAILLDEAVVHRGALAGTTFAGATGGQRKFVFNVWLDCSAMAPGPRRAELRFTDAAGGVRRHVEHVAVAPPLREADWPDSDALVDAPDSAGVSLEQAVAARPSVVRPAVRALFPHGVRSVLVLRTDQLGDMATSAPAVRRLREVLPNAKIVALLTAGNADFAATLGVFDEIIVADFPDDPDERRRLITPAAQEALRARLHAHRFDIAMDLAESAVSRPALLLSGAKFLYGYYDRDWPFLDGGFDATTHDRRNGRECAPQSTKVYALVERLASTLKSHAVVVRRPELGRERLAAVGLDPQARYAVFHTGARIVFSRWDGYGALARLVLERTGLELVIIADDAGQLPALAPEVAASPQLHVFTGRLAFDDFDALLQYAAVFVGNDTGPKHLAALRGTPVVSLHASRINWSEWGQELTGSIVSRKVPCAGCMLHHDADECGRDFTCIRGIRPEEVFAAVEAELAAGA